MKHTRGYFENVARKLQALNFTAFNRDDSGLVQMSVVKYNKGVSKSISKCTYPP